MKRIASTILLVLVLVVTACQDNVYDSLPEKLASFITKYYPDPSIGSYLDNGQGYTVIVREGPTFKFDKQYAWTSVNGNGSPLPQMLLYDQLPQDLYNYIEETGYTGRILTISRDDKSYVASSTSHKITYDIATGKITGSAP